MPRRSRKLDVKELQSMLRMADIEWQRNGLIPMEKGGEAVDYRAMRFLDAYRGVFPSSMPRAVEDVDEFVGNIVFSTINSVMAQTSARDPEVVIRPLGGTAADDNAWRRAWLNQKVMQTMLREKNFRREADRALNSSLILPFGVVRHGYTPEFEEYEDKNGDIIARFKNQTPDLPWIQHLRPWQVRIDPLVNTFDMDAEVGWIAFQQLYRSAADIDDNPNLISSKDWKPTFNYDPRPMHERKHAKPHHKSVVAGRTKKEEDGCLDLWEEWVIFDARRRTWYGVSHGADRLVREERDWPIDWGQLPASILTINEQLDSPFGVPFVEMIWHEQMLYNKLWTVIKAIANRIRRIIFVSEAAFQQNQTQLDNLLNQDSLVEFILADGDVSNIAKEVQFGQLDGQLIGLLYQLREQIREVMGVSSFDRGQRANVETAAEANLIGAGGAVSKSRIQAKFETFWVDIIRAAHRALLQTEDSRSFFIPVIGETNTLFLTQGEIAQGFVEVGLEDLQGEFDYGVKLNSTIPLDPAAELAKIIQVNQAAGGPNDPLLDGVYFRKRIYGLAGEDAERLVISREVANQMGQSPEAAGESAGSPQVQPNVVELAGVNGGAG